MRKDAATSPTAPLRGPDATGVPDCYANAYIFDEAAALSPTPHFVPESSRIAYAIAAWRDGRSVAHELMNAYPVAIAKDEFRNLVRWTFKFTGVDISKPRGARGPASAITRSRRPGTGDRRFLATKKGKA